MTRAIRINDRVIADQVTVADSWWRQARGWIGRTAVERDEALVFRCETMRPRTVHMLGVRTAIGVLWAADGRVTDAQVLAPWTGLGRAPAETLVECHPETARRVAVGDRLTVL